jgi:two-component system sensor histidine kinase HydH
MMHYMSGGEDPLTTLVTETVKESSVVYIKVIGENGRVVASAGVLPAEGKSPPPVQVLATGEPVTRLLSGEQQVFEVAAYFKPTVASTRMNMMMGRWQRRRGMGTADLSDQGPMVIYLGLATSDFEEARYTDIKHAMLLGAILFLTGVGGFILLLVNQRKRVAESTLADMELYTKNVIESMPAGLITLDVHGRVVSCNTRAEAITGKKFAELAGKRLADEMPSCPMQSPDSSQLLDEPVECSHNGDTIPVKVSSSRLIGTDGIVTGMVLVMRDVREVQEMEQKLERSRRLAALGRMATGIAHEIRNPLGTLRGFAQLFKNKFEENETEQEYATLMIDEIDRLNRTISELLQFARPREPEIQDFQLGPLLNKATQLLEDDCKGHEIDLDLTFPANDITMSADPDLVLQMMINLLKNSIEASDKGDTISLSAEAVDKFINITIEDTGKGMNAEQKTKMFDPFYTTRKTGTGLGLAIVHQIMNQHQAGIEVASEPGQGARISLSFPVKLTEVADG